jgi:enterobacterial common antigen flippase
VHSGRFLYELLMRSPSLDSSQLTWPSTVSPASTHRPVADRSYGQILKSSIVIGGSSVVTTLAAIVRTKFVAVFLGPAGLGLMGLFSSMTSMVWTFAGLGMTTSGVREIAEATGSGDDARVARTVAALRRVVLWLGISGSLLLAALSIPISRLTFGTPGPVQIVLLSIVIVMTAVNEGQVARLQGFRRMGDLARSAVLGAVLTLLLTLPIVYVWRQGSVVALLIAASGAAMAASWWYARRIHTAVVHLSWRGTFREATPLVRVGLASMSSAVMVAAAGYFVRVLVARDLGIAAAGIFQSATVLSSVYCGFILTAMGADFLPRVSAAAGDDATCNRLVNEQAEVGLLLAFPGICATVAFSPLIVRLLYSPEFGVATDVLRWQVLGVFLRVASWPLGYLLIAKGKAKLYFWTELSYNLLYAAFIWAGVGLWGLSGAGIAFFGLYVYYCVLMTVVTRGLSGFAWSRANRRFASISIPAVVAVFACPIVFPSPWQFVAAGAVTLVAGLYSLQTLLSLNAFDFLRVKNG